MLKHTIPIGNIYKEECGVDMKRLSFSLLLLVVLAMVVAGCGNTKNTNNKAEEQNKLKVGVIGGPEEEVWKVAKEVAAKDGLEIELVVFSDYAIPNQALEDGSLDANAFQHQPYLDTFNQNNGTHVVRLADTINNPIRIYSKSIKDLSELKDGDVLGLPNDPSNSGRALILFERAGLIKLKEGVGIAATVRDIAENPKHLVFKEMDAAFLPKALGELTAAVINTNFALEGGLSVTEDAIYSEPSDSPWVNIIAVREGETDKPIFQKLIKAYQSDEVKAYIEENYGDSMVPAWK